MSPETTIDQAGVADGIGLRNDGVRAFSVEGLKVVGVSTAPQGLPQNHSCNAVILVLQPQALHLISSDHARHKTKSVALLACALLVFSW